MYQNTTISFPFFGIEWDPIQVIQIGPLSLHIYGLIIGVGLMLAVLYGWRRSRQFGIKTDDITDGVLWIVPFAIVCARAYYCIFEWDERFADDPISVLYIWNGGWPSMAASSVRSLVWRCSVISKRSSCRHFWIWFCWAF